MAKLLIDQNKPEPVKPPPKAKADLPKPPPEKAIAMNNNKPDPIKPPAKKPDAPAKVALNKEAQVPEARVPVPNKPPGEVDAARRKVAGIGLLAMNNDLQELHGAPIAVQLAPVKQGPGVGTSVGVGVGAGTEAGVPVRAMITSNATNGSGGINTAGYSKNTGGGGLAGQSLTMVEGVIGGGGGGGAGGGGARGRGDGTGSGVGGARRQRRRWQPHPRAPAARRHVRSRTCAWCSSATRARSTPSTTVRCATSPACRARSS